MPERHRAEITLRFKRNVPHQLLPKMTNSVPVNHNKRMTHASGTGKHRIIWDQHRPIDISKIRDQLALFLIMPNRGRQHASPHGGKG
ncbi:hypothetical protein Dpoa2040_000331 [Dickeya sp. CFBP 2040]|nr:hypothetical protein [Dickeya sp. CFBP 2040]